MTDEQQASGVVGDPAAGCPGQDNQRQASDKPADFPST